MDSLSAAVHLLPPGAFLATIDWKDAYYSVPVYTETRNYFAFRWNDVTYRFTCLPNGLACAPRYFTKLAKFSSFNLKKSAT